MPSRSVSPLGLKLLPTMAWVCLGVNEGPSSVFHASVVFSSQERRSLPPFFERSTWARQAAR